MSAIFLFRGVLTSDLVMEYVQIYLSYFKGQTEHITEES